jgi:hypothetical protein
MVDTGDGRWLTYSELATIRGINRASAVKLVQRERWPRSSGNERSRIVKMLVPDEWLTPAKEIPPDTAQVPGKSPEDTGMKAVLIARAERAERLADEANKRADVAVALAERTLGQLAEANIRADRAEALAQAAREVADDLRRADTKPGRRGGAGGGSGRLGVAIEVPARHRARWITARCRVIWLPWLSVALFGLYRS